MKRIILVTVLAAVACTAAWKLGYRSGRRAALVEEAASLAMTLSALQELRVGGTLEAIRAMEFSCFAAGASVLFDIEYRQRVRMLLPRLIAYRDAYRTHQAHWTPTEERLETLIRRAE